MKRKKTLRWKNLQPYVFIEVIALAVIIALIPIYYSTAKKSVLADVEERAETWWIRDPSSPTQLNLSNNNFDSISHSIWYSAIQLESYITDFQNSKEWTSDYQNCVHVGLLWDYFDSETYAKMTKWDPTYQPPNGVFLNDSTILLTINSKVNYAGERIVDYSGSELEESGYIDELPFRITEPRTYDLGKYFPREDLKKIISARYEEGLWKDVRVWGRYDENNVITITKVEVTHTNRDGYDEKLFTLVSPDYQYSDPNAADYDPKIIPDILLTSDQDYSVMYEAGCIYWEFEDDWPVLDQNPELADLLLRHTTSQETLDTDDYFVRYYMGNTASSDLSDEIYSWDLSVKDRITSFLSSDNGEIIESENPQVIFCLIVDINRVAHNKANRKILITCLFVQTAALIIMFWRYAVTRRDRDVTELKHTFVNAMAHELKTPVAVIRSTAEYLATGARPEKQPHYINVLTRESDSMDALLNRMLTYSRMTDDNVTLQLTQNDWNAMINKTLASYSDLITEKRMKVVFKERSSEQPFADPSLLEMVIDNLISNAVKYGEPDSTIVIKTLYQKFTIWNKTDAFQGENLNEIWTPMYQTEQKKADSQTGGMGLAICASVLKRHNAGYGAYREADGITFFFDLDRPLKASIPYRVFSGISAVMFMMLLWFFLAAIKIPKYLENGGVERYNGFPNTLVSIITNLSITIGVGLIYLGLHHLRTMPGKTKKTPTD